MRRISSALAMLLTAGSATANTQQQELYTEKNYTVYNNIKSCELYADYEDSSLLRLSYNGFTKTVNFTYYAEKWSRMAVGSSFTVSLATDDDPKFSIGGAGFVVDKGDLKGIHHVGGDEVLTLLQGAKALRLEGPHNIPLAYLDVSGMDTAMKRLKICGDSKTE